MPEQYCLLTKLIESGQSVLTLRQIERRLFVLEIARLLPTAAPSGLGISFPKGTGFGNLSICQPPAKACTDPGGRKWASASPQQSCFTLSETGDPSPHCWCAEPSTPRNIANVAIAAPKARSPDFIRASFHFAWTSRPTRSAPSVYAGQMRHALVDSDAIPRH
jgi:hypothetical protein